MQINRVQKRNLRIGGHNLVKWVSCKIGTMPSYVLISERYKIRVGLVIRYKEEGEVRYRYARIFEVHDNGYFKAVVVSKSTWVCKR